MAEWNLNTIETWKAIPNYEGIYEVSSLGRVRNSSGRILRPNIGNSGYLRIELNQSGNARKFTVHRLVASAFIGDCPPSFVVNHLDGDKLNNRISNLEYCTQRENETHAALRGLKARGSKNGFAKLNEVAAFEIKRMLTAGYGLTPIANRFNVSISTISLIKRGKRWAHV